MHKCDINNLHQSHKYDFYNYSNIQFRCNVGPSLYMQQHSAHVVPVVPEVKMKRKFDMMSTFGSSNKVSPDMCSTLSSKLVKSSEGDV